MKFVLLVMFLISTSTHAGMLLTCSNQGHSSYIDTFEIHDYHGESLMKISHYDGSESIAKSKSALDGIESTEKKINFHSSEEKITLKFNPIYKNQQSKIITGGTGNDGEDFFFLCWSKSLK